MLRKFLGLRICLYCGWGLLAGETLGVITMECVPVTPVVDGNSLVEVECFITSDVNLGIKGLQIGLPCTLPVSPRGAGPLSIISPNIQIFSRTTGSFGGIPNFTGGQGFLAPVNSVNCFMAVSPFPLAPPFQLPAHTTRYAASFIYTVGECAGGEYSIGPEGVTVPPVATNETRIRDDGPGLGILVPIQVVLHTLTIETGRCCSGSDCLGDLNQHCCLNVQGGLQWDANATCADGCPCTVDADCNDNNPCTDDACMNNFCQNNSNTLSCDDGLFCTAMDYCIDAACQGVDSPCSVGQLCNEILNMCVECLVNADCPTDDNPCTDEVCDSDGQCQNVDNALSCNDGLFCTRIDVCSGGVCVGSINRCPPNQTCDEANDRCIQCSSNAECNDNNACTTDNCNASGLCVYTNNTLPCDDGLFCTVVDSCSNGVCRGTETPCATHLRCDETNDRCVECLNNSHCIDDNV